jgi:Mg-chelatase subunit ChlI
VGSGEVPREVRDAPFVQIPLGVTEDRLVGTVDIEASMKVWPNTSRTPFESNATRIATSNAEIF